MKPVVRFFLLREAAQARRKGDTERSELIRSVLEDGDLFDLVSAAAEEEYIYKAGLEGSELAKGPGESFQNFLRFLFDNKEEIFKTILAIIQILSVL